MSWPSNKSLCEWYWPDDKSVLDRSLKTRSCRYIIMLHSYIHSDKTLFTFYQRNYILNIFVFRTKCSKYFVIQWTVPSLSIFSPYNHQIAADKTLVWLETLFFKLLFFRSLTFSIDKCSFRSSNFNHLTKIGLAISLVNLLNTWSKWW